ncbi:MAG: hypothetical protein ABIR80_10615 [Opitutaceae bacterium]
MKSLLVSLVIGLAGCQSSPPPTALPVPARAMPPFRATAALPVLAPTPASAGLESKIRQQAQYIEALISQNDALMAKLATPTIATPPRMSVIPLPPEPAPPPPPVPTPLPLPAPAEPFLTPNADNVIDLAAFVVPAKPGEPVNPFTVRAVPPEAMREVTLHVGGIVSGPVACAVINDRLVQTGEAVESLLIERIEANAVFLRHSGRLLRLPVSEKSTRVRLPL